MGLPPLTEAVGSQYRSAVDSLSFSVSECYRSTRLDGPASAEGRPVPWRNISEKRQLPLRDGFRFQPRPQAPQFIQGTLPERALRSEIRRKVDRAALISRPPAAVDRVPSTNAQSSEFHAKSGAAGVPSSLPGAVLGAAPCPSLPLYAAPRAQVIDLPRGRCDLVMSRSSVRIGSSAPLFFFDRARLFRFRVYTPDGVTPTPEQSRPGGPSRGRTRSCALRRIGRPALSRLRSDKPWSAARTVPDRRALLRMRCPSEYSR